MSDPDDYGDVPPPQPSPARDPEDIDAQAREVLPDLSPLTLRKLAAQPPEVVARVLEIVREEGRGG